MLANAEPAIIPFNRSHRANKGAEEGWTRMKEGVSALVISATQARIIKNIANGATDNATELVLHARHKDLREIMSDKPGRSFSSVGPGRSAMEYASDPIKGG